MYTTHEAAGAAAVPVQVENAELIAVPASPLTWLMVVCDRAEVDPAKRTSRSTHNVSFTIAPVGL